MYNISLKSVWHPFASLRAIITNMQAHTHVKFYDTLFTHVVALNNKMLCHLSSICSYLLLLVTYMLKIKFAIQIIILNVNIYTELYHVVVKSSTYAKSVRLAARRLVWDTSDVCHYKSVFISFLYGCF